MKIFFFFFFVFLGAYVAVQRMLKKNELYILCAYIVLMNQFIFFFTPVTYGFKSLQKRKKIVALRGLWSTLRWAKNQYLTQVLGL